MSTESVICPMCASQIPVAAQSCPLCGTANPNFAAQNDDDYDFASLFAQTSTEDTPAPATPSPSSQADEEPTEFDLMSLFARRASLRVLQKLPQRHSHRQSRLCRPPCLLRHQRMRSRQSR
jgi:predicted amidophosphoribosyltransferase